MPSSLGASVNARGERWVVVGCDRYEHCSVFVLEGGDRENAGERRYLVEPFDRLRRQDAHRLRRRKRDSVLRTAVAAVAAEQPAGGLWTAADATITLLPYQLEPALAALDGATRILLADDVGLGKTVQAGLILSELRARGLVDRALILTPAGLRHSWATELRDRFGLESLVLDQSAVAERTATLPPDVNPWTLKGVTITSLDFAKRAEVMPGIEQAAWDLVIADEAHHLTPGSDRGAAVARLAVRAPWVVLVSATPHSGDEAAFTYLTGLGALGDRLTIFRRSRSDVGFAARRRAHLLAVRPHPSEQQMLRATEQYAKAIWLARGATDRGARLVATTLARRAASSAHALMRSLTRRLALMSGGPDPSPQQPMLPWEDFETADDDDPAWLGCAGLDDGAEERRQLEALILLAQAAVPHASKGQRLVRLLDRVREPALIFTEYRDTLEALQRLLEPSRSNAVIHGGLVVAARQDAIDRFTRGQADTLIATDAAGEGLNLHHRCRLVINIELPWNPLRLEQRVGRVDRIGQTRRVHAVHLYHRHTIEDTVLARLERRRHAAGAWIGEEDIANAALGSSPPLTRAAPKIATSSVAGAATEMSRAAEQRRVRPLIRAATIAQGSWALPRRPARPAGQLTLLFVVHHLDAELRIIDARCVPMQVGLPRRPRDTGAWQVALNEVARDEAIVRACAVEAERLRSAARSATRPLVDAMVPRLERIRRHLSHARVPLRQVSLFDRRSERDAETRRVVREKLEAHLDDRLRQLKGLQSDVCRCSIGLIAAWAGNEP